MKIIKISVIQLTIVIGIFGLYVGHGMAQAGNEALFAKSVQPDVLILLDLSGSMAWNPAGGDNIYGSNTNCIADTLNCSYYSNDTSCTADTNNCSGAGCNNGFCSSSKKHCKNACSTGFSAISTTTCSTDCSRIAIAKRAIFSILDSNGDNQITSEDKLKLGVRLGYMRFYNCGGNEASVDWKNGCNMLIRAIDDSYSAIYCGKDTSCSSITSGASTNNCVNGESVSGGTPLASALAEAKLYLDDHKNGGNGLTADPSKACRSKSVILITDGSDTYACSGDGGECSGNSYKRRREVVLKAKELAAKDSNNISYKLFVIGFGTNMPQYLKNTLNWMAYYGGTDADKNHDGDTATLNLSNLTSCQTDTAIAAGSCIDNAGLHDKNDWYANANDPGNNMLTGYAYITANASALDNALEAVLKSITSGSYSYTMAAVQTVQTSDQGFVYQGSFEPSDKSTFWKGHLKKLKINDSGSISTTAEWDGGLKLQDTDSGDTIANGRNIKTFKGAAGGILAEFKTDTITPVDLGYPISDTTSRNNVVGYIRGEYAYNPEANRWKLGDIFRSDPTTVGKPSMFFDDNRDTNKAFAAYRNSQSSRKRIILAGANDGQLHAFLDDNGEEFMEFHPSQSFDKTGDHYP